MRAVTPAQPAPDLEVPLVGGETWRLADQRPDAFTMVVFYRGLHCPRCRSYLSELQERHHEFRRQGVKIVAISGDSADSATKAKKDWGLEDLAVGYSQSVDSMREWGLFVSERIKDSEPDNFGEPGLFLIAPDGSVYYEAVNSMPWGRPKLEEVRNGIDFVRKHDYPPRGTA